MLRQMGATRELWSWREKRRAWWTMTRKLWNILLMETPSSRAQRWAVTRKLRNILLMETPLKSGSTWRSDHTFVFWVLSFWPLHIAMMKTMNLSFPPRYWLKFCNCEDCQTKCDLNPKVLFKFRRLSCYNKYVQRLQCYAQCKNYSAKVVRQSGPYFLPILRNK